MPSKTYKALAEITLSSQSSSITFNSIPQTYRDLVLVITGRSASSTLRARMRFNNDANSNYSYVRMAANGSTPEYATESSQQQIWLNWVTQAQITIPSTIIINIMEYSATNKHKIVLNRSDVSTNGTEALSNRWASNSAITSINIITDGNNWAVGSTFCLYGIEA